MENVEIFKDDGYAFIDELQKEKKQAAQTVCSFFQKFRNINLKYF